VATKKKKFDPHRVFTSEINSIFYRLRYLIDKPVVVKLRHENLQLVNDDWRSDLAKHLDRMHEEFTRDIEKKTPLDIVQWCIKVKQDVESYGPNYWGPAEQFFNNVLSTSLADYIKEKDFEDALVGKTGKWRNYIQRVNEEINTLTLKLEKLAERQEENLREISELEGKKRDLRDSLEKELKENKKHIENSLNESKKRNAELEEQREKMNNDLVRITKRNKIAGLVDKYSGFLFK
jgi:hypothetical protein